MAEPSRNVYEDAERARAYADLGFPGTYDLAFRDIPALISKHVTGSRARDFGCGTGRSTRFLRDLGMTAIGIEYLSADARGGAAAIPPAHTGWSRLASFMPSRTLRSTSSSPPSPSTTFQPMPRRLDRSQHCVGCSLRAAG